MKQEELKPGNCYFLAALPIILWKDWGQIIINEPIKFIYLGPAENKFFTRNYIRVLYEGKILELHNREIPNMIEL